MKALKKVLPLALALSLSNPVLAQDENVDLSDDTATIEQAEQGSEMIENASTEMDQASEKVMEKKADVNAAKAKAKKDAKLAKAKAKKQVKSAKLKAKKEVKKAKHKAKKEIKKS